MKFYLDDPSYHPDAEEAVVNMLPQVLKKYGVLEELETWKPKETHFEDVRLQKWWKKAVTEGLLLIGIQ